MSYKDVFSANIRLFDECVGTIGLRKPSIWPLQDRLFLPIIMKQRKCNNYEEKFTFTS